MDTDIAELKDGLVIKGSKLKGTTVNGYNDHRIIMALENAESRLSHLSKLC